MLTLGWSLGWCICSIFISPWSKRTKKKQIEQFRWWKLVPWSHESVIRKTSSAADEIWSPLCSNSRKQKSTFLKMALGAPMGRFDGERWILQCPVSIHGEFKRRALFSYLDKKRKRPKNAGSVSSWFVGRSNLMGVVSTCISRRWMAGRCTDELDCAI